MVGGCRRSSPDRWSSFSGLLLLWKGIGRLVVQQPEHTVFFGPVSISADYRAISK